MGISGSFYSRPGKVSTLIVDADLDLAGFDLLTDDIIEKTGAHGVDIDGLILKDSALKTALATVNVVNNAGTTSWVDVDCTAHVGSGKCILILKMQAIGEAGTLHIRSGDEEDGIQLDALNQNGIARWQLYSPNGHFDYKVSSSSDDFSIWLEGFIPLV
jgi:hypothetical protein